MNRRDVLKLGAAAVLGATSIARAATDLTLRFVPYANMEAEGYGYLLDLFS